MFSELFYIIIVSAFLWKRDVYAITIQEKATVTSTATDMLIIPNEAKHKIFSTNITNKNLVTPMTTTPRTASEKQPSPILTTSNIISQIKSNTSVNSLQPTTPISPDIINPNHTVNINSTSATMMTLPNMLLNTYANAHSVTPSTMTETVASPTVATTMQEKTTTDLLITDSNEVSHKTFSTSTTNKTTVTPLTIPSIKATEDQPAVILTTPPGTISQITSNTSVTSLQPTTSISLEITSSINPNKSVDTDSTSARKLTLPNMPLNTYASTYSVTPSTMTGTTASPTVATTVQEETIEISTATDLSIADSNEVSHETFSTNTTNKTPVKLLTIPSIKATEDQPSAILTTPPGTISQITYNTSLTALQPTTSTSPEITSSINTNNSADVDSTSATLVTLPNMPLNTYESTHSVTPSTITGTAASHTLATTMHEETIEISTATDLSIANSNGVSHKIFSTSTTNKTPVTPLTIPSIKATEDRPSTILTAPPDTISQITYNTPVTALQPTTSTSHEITSSINTNNSADIDSTSATLVTLPNMPLNTYASTHSVTPSTINGTAASHTVTTTMHEETIEISTATDLSIANSNGVSHKTFCTSTTNKTPVTPLTISSIKATEDQPSTILTAPPDTISQITYNTSLTALQPTTSTSPEITPSINTNNSADVDSTSATLVTLPNMPLNTYASTHSVTPSTITGTAASHTVATTMHEESIEISTATDLSIADSNEFSHKTFSTNTTNKTPVKLLNIPSIKATEDQPSAILTTPPGTISQIPYNTPVTALQPTTSTSPEITSSINTNNSADVDSTSATLVTLPNMPLNTYASTHSVTPSTITGTAASHTVATTMHEETIEISTATDLSIADSNEFSHKTFSTNTTNKTPVKLLNIPSIKATEDQPSAILTTPPGTISQIPYNTPVTALQPTTSTSPEITSSINTNNSADVDSTSATLVTLPNMPLNTYASTHSVTPSTINGTAASHTVTTTMHEETIEISTATDLSIANSNGVSHKTFCTSTTNKTPVTLLTISSIKATEDQPSTILTAPPDTISQITYNTSLTALQPTTSTSPEITPSINTNNSADVDSTSATLVTLPNMPLNTYASTHSITPSTITGTAASHTVATTMHEETIDISTATDLSIANSNGISHKTFSTSTTNKTPVTPLTIPSIKATEDQPSTILTALPDTISQITYNTSVTALQPTTSTSPEITSSINTNNSADVDSTSATLVTLPNMPLNTYASTHSVTPSTITGTAASHTVATTMHEETIDISTATDLSIANSNGISHKTFSTSTTNKTPVTPLTIPSIKATEDQPSTILTALPDTISQITYNTSVTALQPTTSTSPEITSSINTNNSADIDSTSATLVTLPNMSLNTHASRHSDTTSTIATKVLPANATTMQGMTTTTSPLSTKVLFTTQTNLISFPNTTTKTIPLPSILPSSTAVITATSIMQPVKYPDKKRSDDLKSLLIVSILMLIVTASCFIAVYRMVKRNITKAIPNSNDVDPEIPIYTNQRNKEHMGLENNYNDTLNVHVSHETPLYAKPRRKSQRRNKKEELMYANQSSCAVGEDIPMQAIYENALPTKQLRNSNWISTGQEIMGGINESPKVVYAQIQPKRKRNLPIYINIPTLMEPMTAESNEPTYNEPHNI